VLASWLIASGYAPTAVIERDNITRRGLARLLREHRVSEGKRWKFRSVRCGQRLKSPASAVPLRDRAARPRSSGASDRCMKGVIRSSGKSAMSA